jgi:hypothetical protein
MKPSFLPHPKKEKKKEGRRGLRRIEFCVFFSFPSSHLEWRVDGTGGAPCSA